MHVSVGHATCSSTSQLTSVLLCVQHTVFLIFILSLSAFNGASFYFEVFAHR